MITHSSCAADLELVGMIELLEISHVLPDPQEMFLSWGMLPTLALAPLTPKRQMITPSMALTEQAFI